jgi:hypothetical protein
MPDQVLQPVDVPSLELYLQSAVPEIQTPIYIKQVRDNSTDQCDLHS